MHMFTAVCLCMFEHFITGSNLVSALCYAVTFFKKTLLSSKLIAVSNTCPQILTINAAVLYLGRSPLNRVEFLSNQTWNCAVGVCFLMDQNLVFFKFWLIPQILKMELFSFFFLFLEFIVAIQLYRGYIMVVPKNSYRFTLPHVAVT